jgi:hypothetical protein
MLEATFRKKLVDDIEAAFPGIVTLIPDTRQIQGIPDRIFLLPKTWFALETKRGFRSSYQPNQLHWIEYLNSLSYARSVNPDNVQEVLNELQRTF